MNYFTPKPTSNVNEDDSPPDRTEPGGSLKPKQEENKSTSNQQLG